jgi:hypothetical protein
MVKYVLEMKYTATQLAANKPSNSQQEQHDKGVHPPTGYISLSLHNGLGSLGLISQKFFYKLLLNSNGKTNCTIEIRTHKNPKND